MTDEVEFYAWLEFEACLGDSYEDGAMPIKIARGRTPEEVVCNTLAVLTGEAHASLMLEKDEQIGELQALLDEYKAEGEDG